MIELKEYIKYFVKHVAMIRYLQLKSGIDCLRPERDAKLYEFPEEIQLPITYKCNFNCIMCGMRNLQKNKDFSAEELKVILSDKLFSKVRAVGINGGEPFLKSDLIECFDVMLSTLPCIQVFNVISNGYFIEKYKTVLPKLKKKCNEKGVKLNLTLSLDGIRDMQEFHRGHKQAWQNINATFRLINKNPEEYYDTLNIICTITKHNIYRVVEVENWSRAMGIKVEYNVATVNVRIDNTQMVDDFSLFGDEHARLMAQEFFYTMFIQEKSQRYFAIYYYIRHRKRISACPCKNNRWVTLTPNKQLGFCATHSNELGDAYERSAYEIFNENLEHLNLIKKKFCTTCSHYSYELTKHGKKEYYKELIHNIRN